LVVKKGEGRGKIRASGDMDEEKRELEGIWVDGFHDRKEVDFSRSHLLSPLQAGISKLRLASDCRFLVTKRTVGERVETAEA
jgi:hypothetical protein